MTLRSASTITAQRKEMMNATTVTTTTENAADFGCLLPSSLLTLTLLLADRNKKHPNNFRTISVIVGPN